MTDKLQKEGLPRHSVAGKVYALRKYHNISQEVLADSINMSLKRIRNVEKGLEEYGEKDLDAIKKYFNIVGLPLTEDECFAFRARLYYLLDLIRAKRMDEAKAIQKEMVNIDNLKPCDLEMVMLCKMMEVQLFIAEGNYIATVDKLNISQDGIKKMSNENLFHYFYNKGAFYTYQDRYEEGLDFLLRSLKLMKDNEKLIPNEDGWLYYNIALCYSYLEIPYYAISFWQKAIQAHPDNKVVTFTLNADRGIALNYIKVNQLEDAEKLLRKCQVKSDGIKDDVHIGFNLFCYGYMYKKAENWVSAIEYFDKAVDYLPKGSDQYYSSLYHKIHCVIHNRAFPEAKELLNQAKNEYGSNESWKLCFIALEHYLAISKHMTSLNNGKSIYYIRYIAIPHFIKTHDYFTAIDYYTLLEKHYEKRESMMNSLYMTKAIRDIYKRCYESDGRSNKS